MKTLILPARWFCRWVSAQAVAVFPGIVLVADPSVRLLATPAHVELIRHERIHHRQQLETLILGFYLLYFGGYLLLRLRSMDHRQAYHALWFEREAYAHQHEEAYLSRRRPFAWWRYAAPTPE